MEQQQKGFTLVEIAVVLVIIGLLLGAILQGQQLIASARVSNLSDQQAGIQAAYFGFIDRYRETPGDMMRNAAREAIGDAGIVLGNTDSNESNGRLADPNDGNWRELNGVWEHLSKAGFLRGSYVGPTGNAPSSSDHAPTNAFNGVVILARHNGYADDDAGEGDDPPLRLLYHFGQNVPASIARELDVKLDDGRPQTGSMRNSVDDEDPSVWESGADCTDENAWDIDRDEQNCNPVFIF